MRKRIDIIALLTALVLLISACGPADPPPLSSDLAVLAQGAQDYLQARPGRALVFPRDHGPHPGYRIEWWYLTANLDDAAGNAYGAQWTLFRLAVVPPGQSADATTTAKPWHSQQVFMAHIGITTLDDHVSFQRYSRAGEHQETARAGVMAMPFSAWLDDWSLQSTGADWLPLEVRARQGKYALHLQLHSDKPLVLQGDAGFSQKHANGGGSYYYSQPFLQARGELTVDGKAIPVSGEAWLDREWSSQFLQTGQHGWDWFSIHLQNGEKLMLFQVRQSLASNQDDHFLHGTLMAVDGSTIRLRPDQIQLESIEQTRIQGRSLPLRWRIKLPQIGRQFDVEALHPQQWMDVDYPYWEGAIIVSGEGPANSGRGYMELTGYLADES